MTGISWTDKTWNPTLDVVIDQAKLSEPLSWRKPRRVFVNSMSDLFHEALTNEQIAAVFGVMAACIDLPYLDGVQHAAFPVTP